MSKGQKYTKHLDETLRQGVYGTQVPNIAFLYKAIASSLLPVFSYERPKLL